MGLSIQNPLVTFDNGLVKKSKYLMVKTLALQQARNASKAEEKVKKLMEEFSRDIHSGSTGGLDVRI